MEDCNIVRPHDDVEIVIARIRDRQEDVSDAARENFFVTLKRASNLRRIASAKCDGEIVDSLIITKTEISGGDGGGGGVRLHCISAK